MDESARNLMLSYLSAAGSAMSQGKQIGPSLDLITQEAVKRKRAADVNENYVKMLKSILSGGGDIKLGKDKTSINIPSNQFGGLGSEFGGITEEDIITGEITKYPPDEGQEVGQGQGQGQAKAQAQTQTQAKVPAIPTKQNDVFSALLGGGIDLEGMTPEMLVSALTLGQSKRKMDIEQMEAMGVEEKELAPMNVPGIGKLTLEKWKALDTETKEYAAYVVDAKSRGEMVMSRKEFRSADDKPTTAVSAAISSYIDEYGKVPPPEELKRINETFGKKPTRPLVTWTTATDNLTERFGSLDPTGKWAITPGLQATHRLAQKVLVELKDKDIDPLRAVNLAEGVARDYYKNLETVTEEGNKIEDDDRRRAYIQTQLEKLKKIFYRELGIYPGE